MLQSLLAERFDLKLHHEKKELPVYVLTVSKAEVKLHESKQGHGGFRIGGAACTPRASSWKISPPRSRDGWDGRCSTRPA